MTANRAAQSRFVSSRSAPPTRRRPFLTTGGLKGWQYGVLVVSCVGSMLAGASVVHRVFAPDLVRNRVMHSRYQPLCYVRSLFGNVECVLDMVLCGSLWKSIHENATYIAGMTFLDPLE